jgi:RimJ/RimL family protein N-acetyltransferase
MSTPLPNKVEDTVSWIKSTIEKINSWEEIVLVWIDKSSNEFIGIRWLHKITSGYPEPWLWTKKQNSLWKGWIGKEWLIEFVDWIQKNLEFNYLTFYIDENNRPSQKLGDAIWWIPDSDDEWNKIILKSATSLGKELNLVKYKLYKMI